MDKLVMAGFFLIAVTGGALEAGENNTAIACISASGGCFLTAALWYAVTRAIPAALDRRAARDTVLRLLDRTPMTSWTEWQLPAAESFALLFGQKSLSTAGPTLAMLQLVAMDVLEPDGSDGGTQYGTLAEGRAASAPLTGSTAAMYRLWDEVATGTSRQATETTAAPSPAREPGLAAGGTRLDTDERVGVNAAGGPDDGSAVWYQHGAAGAHEINSRVRRYGPAA
jgi:hypothetical protein